MTKSETNRKRNIWAIAACSLGAALLIIVLCQIFIKPGDNGSERISVWGTAAACFEFIDDKDKGYKLFTSEIATLWTFDSLCLEPSEEAFKGDWIYRIIYNPKSYVGNGKEIVVLFGENNLSINGDTYVAENGVDYADILNWAAYKYKYYDYELQQ